MTTNDRPRRARTLTRAATARSSATARISLTSARDASATIIAPHLSIRAPARADLARVAAEGQALGHNYPRALVGTSDCDERGRDSPQAARLRAHGGFWAVDRTRARVGRGADAYARAVKALRAWEHFDLGWARVEGDTGTEAGASVCVRARLGPVWTVNPLEVVRLRVDDSGKGGDGRPRKRFAFAHGTLGGHLLAGEERFSVELASDGEVFYEAYAFSRPAHALSVLGYPVVRLMQKKFHRDSSEAMRRIVREASGQK